MREEARYEALTRHSLCVTLLALVVIFCGCASWNRQPDQDPVKLILYQPNQKPLATLQLLLPGSLSTNWSAGQWRGELSNSYVRPQEHHVLPGDLLDAPSWRPLGCLIDKDNPKFIFIDLQPDQPTNGIRISIPRQKPSFLPSSWYHWTEGGGGKGGTVRILQR